MRIPDEKLAEVFDRGFTVVEGFLDKPTLARRPGRAVGDLSAARGLFRRPGRLSEVRQEPVRRPAVLPLPVLGAERVPVYPDLIDAAERFLQTKEIDCYKIELWAKYAGAIDYDQTHHRDYENHTIVVPRADQLMPQMTCFILLSDVTELDGPTKAVPLEKTRHIPLGDHPDQDGRASSTMRWR